MIYILTEQDSARLQYVLSFIFKEVYDMPFRVILLDDDRPSDADILLVYGKDNEGLNGWSPKITIPRTNLLFESGIRPLCPEVTLDPVHNLPIFFKASDNGNFDFTFDLFSVIFYCITRYEEYGSQEKDGYGRFPALASMAGKHGFLDLPLIDSWLDILIRMLEEKSGQTIPKKQNFAVFPTIDIDRVWAYAHKEKSHLPGLLKDFLTGHFTRIPVRLRAIKNPKTDPFFTFGYIDKLLTDSREKPLYFILYAKNPDAKDINHPRTLDAFKRWLTDFSKSRTLGIHPSFQSHRSPEILADEIKSLEQAIEQPVLASRQHFILLHVPETYRRLADAGVKHDYSLGYPDSIGYRASTGYSFHWYDLEKEIVTPLRIHPFECMDVTLKKYMRLGPEEVIRLISGLLEKAQKAGSPVRFIWHNSSFYTGNGWQGWDKVFRYLAAQATR